MFPRMTILVFRTQRAGEARTNVLALAAIVQVMARTCDVAVPKHVEREPLRKRLAITSMGKAHAHIQTVPNAP